MDNLTCTSCGGTFQYDIPSKEIKCVKCGNVSPISIDGNIIKHKLYKDLKIAEEKNADHVLDCISCGSKIIVPKNAFSVTCSYCGTVQPVYDNYSSLQPEAIIPFEITNVNAISLFKTWIHSISDAKLNLKRDFKLGNMSKVYYPYWDYDCFVSSSYTAYGGEVFFKTVGSQNKVDKERTISWHDLSGNLENHFEDIAINCDVNRNNFIYKLENFDFKKLKPFNMIYLNGFSAIKYSEDPLSCFEYAKSKIGSNLFNEVNSNILKQYRESKIEFVNTIYNDVKFTYILLPFWTGTYIFENQRYCFLVNGENGLIDGEYPSSKIKASLRNIGTNLMDQSKSYIKDRIPRNFPRL